MNQIPNIETIVWKDYELIDSGDFEKLERFGSYVVRRPEPQALWNKSKSEKFWQDKAQATFVRDNTKKSHRDSDNINGGWTFKVKPPTPLIIEYKELNLKFKLSFTSFGHLGIFVEQLSNWHYLDQQIRSFKNKPKVLNLFAYTGGASIVSANAGADVTHLDSVKNVVTWARENKELSKAPEIRWLVEDALKFVKKQASKNQIYQGIILDPPAYGRGPNNEKWVLEEQINELIHYSAQILDKNKAFVLLNLYSMGLSGTIGVNLIKQHLNREAIWGECVVPSSTGINLPLCTYVRCNY